MSQSPFLGGHAEVIEDIQDAEIIEDAEECFSASTAAVFSQQRDTNQHQRSHQGGLDPTQHRSARPREQDLHRVNKEAPHLESLGTGIWTPISVD